MASQAQSKHYIAFYAGVTGLTTGNFSIPVFRKDGAGVDTDTSSSFTVVEVGGGYYYAYYVPSVAGIYYLAFTDSANSVNVFDVADISSAPNVFNLTQDTGGTGALLPTIPVISIAGLSTPPDINQYLLMVYQSSDWDVGRTDNTYAVAMTELDSSGNWLTTPLTVLPGTYHIVIKNNYGTIQVIKPYLEVPLADS